ncbi:hypothetical protein BABINDRAFT_162466 [Babjeviella inositovora NRRL Y-12698]|uniref:Uncharacterized protein n=1 Tax=Babjeviella inositovora NRRL Y-12698 TaxID=984486 RepID=A0A1E3QM76_9ASCO|nr:uncharacterized protein BABINDRAFT_162466 [Babjeviella inositovora NRRL Y-12698]ODQ78785.1 hypothetical protein BABINDRAFT_162466 [Babjeviella inositovora NRRL Y-12698]
MSDLPHTPLDSEVEAREAAVQRILELRSHLGFLLYTAKDTQRSCARYEVENQYLQDYVGTLMTTAGINKAT